MWTKRGLDFGFWWRVTWGQRKVGKSQESGITECTWSSTACLPSHPPGPGVKWETELGSHVPLLLGPGGATDWSSRGGR